MFPFETDFLSKKLVFLKVMFLKAATDIIHLYKYNKIEPNSWNNKIKLAPNKKMFAYRWAIRITAQRSDECSVS